MDLRWLLFIVITLLCGYPLCQTESISNKHNISTTKYCGKRLSQTLSAVCNGIYNTLNKKSNIYDNSFWNAQFTSDIQKDGEYPFRSKTGATSLITSFRRRRKRGVFNECCQKPCSYEELASYCGK